MKLEVKKLVIVLVTFMSMTANIKDSAKIALQRVAYIQYPV